MHGEFESVTMKAIETLGHGVACLRLSKAKPLQNNTNYVTKQLGGSFRWWVILLLPPSLPPLLSLVLPSLFFPSLSLISLPSLLSYARSSTLEATEDRWSSLELRLSTPDPPECSSLMRPTDGTWRHKQHTYTYIPLVFAIQRKLKLVSV